MKKLKISLCIVTRGEILIETTMCLIHAIEKLSPHKIHLNFHRGTYIHELRNNAFQEALNNKADYLMFIDSDVTFPPDGIAKLVAQNKDIIGGNYNMKCLPLTSTVKIKGKDGKIQKKIKFPTKQSLKVFAVPTGFMLIKLDKVKDLLNPFDFDRNPDNTLIGEDVNFCKRCGERGIEVWCDPTIPIGHIGEYLY